MLTFSPPPVTSLEHTEFLISNSLVLSSSAQDSCVLGIDQHRCLKIRKIVENTDFGLLILYYFS